MSRAEFENLLMKHLDGQIQATEQQRLQELVDSDEELRKEWETAKQLQTMSRDWRDLAPPAWNRVPVTLNRPSFWRGFFQWAPLALGFALILATFFNVQVTRTSDGFQLSFGEPTVTESDLKLVEKRVTQLMGELQSKHQQQLADALNEFAQEQDSAIENAIMVYESTRQQQSRDEMKALFANWRKQRELDLQVISDRYQDLYDASVANRNGLITLAQYVKK